MGQPVSVPNPPTKPPVKPASRPVKPAPKPAKPQMTGEKLMKLMDQYPEYVEKYYHSNRDQIEEYIVENFWEEDVERWLVAIRKRSPKEQLQVRKIDFNRTGNTLFHRTDRYENKDLIVRRAAQFTITVVFGNRPFDPKRDDVYVVFGIGPTPNEAAGTKITCPALKEPGAKTKWNCSIVSSNESEKSISLKINIPANAVVGRYAVSFEVVSGVQKGREKSTHTEGNIVVIFNPFSKDDTVFMDGQEQRDEYVMNDMGFINVGSYGKMGENIHQRPWSFAQFDEGVLDSVLEMMENDTRMLGKMNKNLKRCNSPVFISRVLAAMVNCNNDSGVLWGRWDGEYEDGKKPTIWGDSAKILLQWKNNDRQPVKYGQCWVFSGILTTALRALGIPARSVTNFESAHDTDRNETVDMYFDKDTHEKLDETSDSVWNFHVWNEGYFKRPDLPPGYDGWQVVDATPQEESGDLMQCGPAPVKAVKEGDINIGFDTGFVFSEVNADKVYWFVDTKEGKITGAPGVNRRAVGKYIGTKAVGAYTTVDIINEYKYREGSEEERKAFKKAYGLGSGSEGLAFETDRELVPPTFEVKVEINGQPVIGDDLNFKITVKNIAKNPQETSVKVKVNSKRHTGKVHAILKNSKQTITLGVGEVHQVTLQVAHDEYISNIVDDYAINVTAVASNVRGGDTTVEELDTILEIPDCISVVAPEDALSGEETTFNVVFTNKLPVKLTGGEFEISGRGIVPESNQDIKVNEPLLPNQTLTIERVKLQSKWGWRSVYGSVIFNCTQLKAIRHDFRIRLKV